MLAELGSMETFFLALLAGLLVCAPPGPLGAVCARTAALHGRAAGIRVGIAIALGECAHAVLAALGSFDLGRLPRAGRLLLGASLALVFGYLALRAWRNAPAQLAAERSKRRSSSAGPFLLSLATPGTLPAFVLIFSTFGLSRADGLGWIVAGVLCGSILWWVLVSAVAYRLRGQLERSPLLFARACSALFLLGAGGALRAVMT